MTAFAPCLPPFHATCQLFAGLRLWASARPRLLLCVPFGEFEAVFPAVTAYAFGSRRLILCGSLRLRYRVSLLRFATSFDHQGVSTLCAIAGKFIRLAALR